MTGVFLFCFFAFLNILKNLDPYCKADLDLWDYAGPRTLGLFCKQKISFMILHTILILINTPFPHKYPCPFFRNNVLLTHKPLCLSSVLQRVIP